MRGKPDNEIVEERETAIREATDMLRKKGIYDVICVLNSSFYNGYTPDKTHNVGLRYLSEDLKVLADADYIFLAKGWEKARGCIIEHDCAVAWDIPRLFNQEYASTEKGE